MSVRYTKLWHLMLDRNLKKKDLKDLVGISKGVITNMGNNEYVRLETIEKICKALNVGIDDIMELKGYTTMPLGKVPGEPAPTSKAEALEILDNLCNHCPDSLKEPVKEFKQKLKHPDGEDSAVQKHKHMIVPADTVLRLDLAPSAVLGIYDTYKGFWDQDTSGFEGSHNIINAAMGNVADPIHYSGVVIWADYGWNNAWFNDPAHGELLIAYSH